MELNLWVGHRGYLLWENQGRYVSVVFLSVFGRASRSTRRWPRPSRAPVSARSSHVMFSCYRSQTTLMLTSRVVMDRLEQSIRTGRFTLPSGKEVLGELTLAGAQTSLYLHDGDDF